MSNPASEPHILFEPLRRLHEIIRRKVVEASEGSSSETLAEIAREEEGDTIYAVDRISEELLIEFFEHEVAPRWPLVLIAEGLPKGKVILPRGTPESAAVWRIIVDPIDGTRGLMYQKRSAWVLTGVASNRGVDTNLSDIEFAIQSELPLAKQHLSDCLWAVRGKGTKAETFNRLTGEHAPLFLQPSRAQTIAHGYAQIARFFPGAREELSAIDEEIVHAALGPVLPGKAHCFEDQYASSAGQLYELMTGHDRFTADLRPFMEKKLPRRRRDRK